MNDPLFTVLVRAVLRVPGWNGEAFIRIPSGTSEGKDDSCSLYPCILGGAGDISGFRRWPQQVKRKNPRINNTEDVYEMPGRHTPSREKKKHEGIPDVKQNPLLATLIVAAADCHKDAYQGGWYRTQGNVLTVAVRVRTPRPLYVPSCAMDISLHPHVRYSRRPRNQSHYERVFSPRGLY